MNDESNDVRKERLVDVVGRKSQQKRRQLFYR